ncbi:MAG: DUF2158 domain-containing protein [Alphaproteobacteria bacterium]
MSADSPKPKFPELGEIVRLKSGGPPMTVTGSYPEEGSIWCRWFWRGRVFKEEFALEYIEPAEPDR